MTRKTYSSGFGLNSSTLVCGHCDFRANYNNDKAVEIARKLHNKIHHPYRIVERATTIDSIRHIVPFEPEVKLTVTDILNKQLNNL